MSSSSSSVSQGSFERMVVALVQSHGDAAEDMLSEYLLRIGCSSNDIIALSSSWREADETCGASHPVAFTRELLHLLRTRLSVPPIAPSIIAPDDVDKLLRERTEAVRKRLRSAVSSLRMREALSAQRRSMRAGRVNFPPSFTASVFAPLRDPACVWGRGDASVGGDSFPVVAAIISSDKLMGIRRAEQAFVAMAEVFSVANMLAEPMIPTPAIMNWTAGNNTAGNKTTGDHTVGDLRLSFRVDCRLLVPLSEVASAALSIGLIRSTALLDFWCLQMHAMLVAMEHNKTRGSVSFSLEGPVFVGRDGRLLIAGADISSECHWRPMASLIKDSIATMLGTSRSIRVSIGSAASARVRVSLMQGCSLAIEAHDDAGPLTIEAASSGDNRSVLMRRGDSHLDTVQCTDNTDNTDNTGKRMVNTGNTVVVSACEDSRNPLRTVTIELVRTSTSAAVNIDIQVFALPLVEGAVSAELLGCLHSMHQSKLPEQHILLTAALSTAPVKEINKQLVQAEWEKLLASAVE